VASQGLWAETWKYIETGRGAASNFGPVVGGEGEILRRGYTWERRQKPLPNWPRAPIGRNFSKLRKLRKGNGEKRHACNELTARKKWEDTDRPGPGSEEMDPSQKEGGEELRKVVGKRRESGGGGKKEKSVPKAAP